MKAKELIVVALVSVTISLASLYQTLVYIQKTPSGFHYPLVHNYEQDFYWYLSLMRQGYDGALVVTSRYTPENFPPKIVNTYFPFAGMAAGMLGMSLPVMYTVLRVVGGTVLLIVSFTLLRVLRLPGGQTLTAFVLMIIGAPFWYFQDGSLHQVGEFWTGFDPLLRVTWLPHHTLSNALMILVMILLDRSVVLAGIIGALAIWLNPASFFILLGGIFLWKQKIAIYFLLLAIPVIVLWEIQNSQFPWTAFRDWERFVQYPMNAWGYLGTLGVVGILALPAIPQVLKKRNFRWNIVLWWFAVPFLGLFITGLPISNGRFLQTAGYIPAAILAATAIARQRQSVRNIGLIAISLIFIPSLVASLERQTYYVDRNMENPLVYIQKDTWDALSFLDRQPGGVIAAPQRISTLIPAFSSFRVLGGHPTFTYLPVEKSTDLEKLYRDGDPSIIQKYAITAVWVSPAEDTGIWQQRGLHKAYANPSVVIYER
jgi:hypothetical protein